MVVAYGEALGWVGTELQGMFSMWQGMVIGLRFWHGAWCKNRPLIKMHLELYVIMINKDDLVQLDFTW